jgi:hypothetical protein
LFTPFVDATRRGVEARIETMAARRHPPLGQVGGVSIPGCAVRLPVEEDETMRYMLLIYGDEKAAQKMSREEGQAIFREYGEFTDGIRKSGAFLAGDPLQPTSTATTVRSKNGKAVTMDGPFAETKEQLGGYYIVEAKDLDQAIAIASRIPSARMGGAVEVRPIMELGPRP